MLQLDLFLMEQAVANVIDNSAKYAGPGCRLRIAARRQLAQVVLEISDNGSGIRAEDLQRVFEPFYRGTGPQGRLGAGTGLGLAICRAFVEANRGSVAALSAGLGQGTTVRITLPA
jgi:two-component system sensor histidine kinase KdpD